MKYVFIKILFLIAYYFAGTSGFISDSRYNFLLSYFIKHYTRPSISETNDLWKASSHGEPRRTKERRASQNVVFARRVMEKGCGVRYLEPVSPSIPREFRIVGGKKAPLGAWPWIAALGFKTNSTLPEFLCGGALVSPLFVLTAAHCVYGRPDLYMVRLGEHNLLKEDDGASPVDILIDKQIVHEQYDPDGNVNDIALLKIKTPVKFNRYIQPICLPSKEESNKISASKAQAWIAGWGAKSYQGPSSPALLQLGINLIEEKICKKAFELFQEKTIIDDRIICAGVLDGGRDACQGDSGGPLMWESKDSFYVIGVISLGYKCAEPGFPGIYTKVTSFVDWLRKHMN